MNEIASKIFGLLPEIILPTFIQSINKHLLSINLTNYLYYVLNSTNTSHDGSSYALHIQNPHWPPKKLAVSLHSVLVAHTVIETVFPESTTTYLKEWAL